MPRPPVFSPALLQAALSELEGRRSSIVHHIAEIRNLLAGTTRKRGRPRNEEPQVKSTAKRTLSRGARERIAAAQRKRWAAQRKQATKAVKKGTKQANKDK